MPVASENQLQEFFDCWMTFAKSYQLRNQNEPMSQGLSVSQYYALSALANSEGHMTMSGFAQELDLSFAGVNRMIEGLVRKGLVKKATSKSDGRVQEVQLTARGRNCHEAVYIAFFDHVRVTLSEIQDRDRAAVIRGIQTIVRSIPKWRKSLNGAR